MNRADSLIGRMTLAEKLGQLTMTAAGFAVTGPIIAGDSTESIKNGTLGNLLNLYGAEHIREMQHLAINGSRLGIPLMFGLRCPPRTSNLVSDTLGRGVAIRFGSLVAYRAGISQGGRQ